MVELVRRRQSSAASRFDDFVSLINHLAEPCLLIHNQQIIAVNQPMEDLIYKGREELLGNNPYDVWDALEFNIAPREEIAEHITREGSWHFVTKLNRQDGSPGHGEVRISLLDEVQELIIVFITDITDRVESDRRLRENEMRLATSQAIAGLGYWHYHVNEGSIEWSDELLRITGLDDPESLERYPTNESRWQLIHPGDVELLRSRMESAIRTGVVPPETNFRILRPDDDLRHARVRFGMVRGPDDQIEELFGVVQDITDFVRAEQRLRHAQRMEAIGSLTGGISHDFNNLLQVIMGNAELLQDSIEPAGEESLKTIRHAAQRGSELTQLLLAYSRRQHLEPRTVNVNDYVSGILPLLTRTLGETITLESNQAADLRRCQVDPGQLENCILNLAINAQHAMADGGTLTIETRNVHLDEDYAGRYDEVTAGDYVQLTIRDTGAGMSEAVPARAFAPFF
ncbi:MAG: PAS domain S-box protein, partial [Pseudomonadales bacterium]|nr:PAS domain S-box protein [Pseudomonadales bacterium]